MDRKYLNTKKVLINIAINNLSVERWTMDIVRCTWT